LNEVRIKLHPKQFEVFDSEATEILYGGAAGAGKSMLMRAIAIALTFDIPNLQVYLFRRTYPDLIANHMNGSGSLPELIAPFIESGQCKLNLSKNEIEWRNGAKIHLCHCQHEQDVLKYQGAEIHVLLIDELTHFTEYMYRFLRNRVRLGGLIIPEHWKARLPLIISGSNPGGVGHQWVKRTFIDMSAPNEVRRMPKEEGGMIRQFIPARLEDNPTLTENDPGYVDRLTGLGSENLVRAMREGDWNITAGAAFEKLSRIKHSIRPFSIPSHWTKFTSIDWGTAKPYANCWFAVNDEEVIIKARGSEPSVFIPPQSIILYRELYGWNGKPNEGCREESWQVAQKILSMENGEKIDYRIGDSAMWAEHDGPSVAESFRKNGIAMEQSKKDRAANYLEMRNRIDPDKDMPGFFIFETCNHFWRTVPDLQLDERNPEKGPESSQEDHLYDACSYGIVSRPMVWTRKARVNFDYEDSREKAFEAERGKTQSRY
jgi:hypothetical protein